MKVSVIVLCISVCFAWPFKFQQQQQNPNMWQIINSTAQFSLFRLAMERTPQLRDLLAGNSSSYQQQDINQITVFAPTNQAFQKMPQALQTLFLNQTVQNPPQLPNYQAQQAQNQSVSKFRSPNALLEGLLAYHIHPGSANITQEQFQSSNLTLSTLLEPFNLTIWSLPVPSNQTQQQMIQSQYDSFSVSGMYANEANVTQGFNAQNGILYAIDGVVSPLWYANISLSNVSISNIPQLITIMGSFLG